MDRLKIKLIRTKSTFSAQTSILVHTYRALLSNVGMSNCTARGVERLRINDVESSAASNSVFKTLYKCTCSCINTDKSKLEHYFTKYNMAQKYLNIRTISPNSVAGKGKSTLNRLRRAQRGSRGIALFILDFDARRGWVISTTPRPLNPPGKNRYRFYRRQPQGWCEKSRPHRDSIPRPSSR
jgi:hypothetical protein